MEIITIKATKGPNYWSNYRQKLIVMELNIGRYEEFPTNKLPGFSERLLALIPSLMSHRCSEGVHGGFCQRMNEGTWLGHVIEHVALELQWLAGMDCGFGRTRSTGKTGVYNVVFSYISEAAGRYAAKAAVQLVEAVATNQSIDLKAEIQQLEDIYDRERVGPSTQSILDEATKRGIPFMRLNNDSLYMLGYGKNQQLFQATVMGNTSNIAVETVADKALTKSILQQNEIPVPAGMLISNEQELDEVIAEVGFPLVIKPVDGNHGRGITINIYSKSCALKAMETAQKISRNVIAERYITGDDYRFLVVNFKLVAVAKRTPAKVTGDGVSTISQLIKKVNADPDRGSGHEKILTAIKVDQHTKQILSERGLTLNSVIAAGKDVYLKKTANLSTGGTSTDVTDLVHPDNVFMAERIARLMNLNVCGIDIMASCVETPLTLKTGAILEVNAGPGFRMHTSPSEGTPRNVAEPIIDMLFPDNANGRIPVVAVTGTNGKTTTTRLIAHIAKHAGMNVGYTTTDGIYINNHLVSKGDCSGPQSAGVVLRDPSVDYAVLECARGGILRSGLGFDKCNISIVTNISDDHMGQGGIDTMKDYIRIKEVVPASTFNNGYAILNADDDQVYTMRENLDCRVVLFSIKTDNPRIISHCENGGLAIIVEDGFFTVCQGTQKIKVMAVKQIPLTFSGTAEFMVKNILPAMAAALLSGFNMKTIQVALRTFFPSPETTPGRMNLFAFEDFNLMLDYVHNEAGFLEIEKYVKTVEATHKVGIIAGTGDRKDEDIQRLGRYAAQIFDELIIRHDKDSRGRNNEEMTQLLLRGIREVKPEAPVTVISDEQEAIGFAIKNARSGSFIFACADNVWQSIDIINGFCKKQELISLKAS